MVFVDFYRSSIGLHVNGNAEILSNKELEAGSVLSEKIKQALKKSSSRKPIAWVKVEVEEAYIHCSKHIPLMEKRDKTIHWGTGDY